MSYNRYGLKNNHNTKDFRFKINRRSDYPILTFTDEFVDSRKLEVETLSNNSVDYDLYTDNNDDRYKVIIFIKTMLLATSFTLVYDKEDKSMFSLPLFGIVNPKSLYNKVKDLDINTYGYFKRGCNNCFNLSIDHFSMEFEQSKKYDIDEPNSVNNCELILLNTNICSTVDYVKEYKIGSSIKIVNRPLPVLSLSINDLGIEIDNLFTIFPLTYGLDSLVETNELLTDKIYLPFF